MSKGKTHIQLRPKQHNDLDSMYAKFPWCVPVYFFVFLVLGSVIGGIIWVGHWIWSLLYG